MKLLEVLLVVAAATLAYAGREGCDIPLSETDKGLKFTASSYADDREPYRARLTDSKAWCAKSTVKYKEYLQVNLSSLRHISAIEIQGAKWSFREFYVKNFMISYSIEGTKKSWKFYKSQSKSGSKLLTFAGNTDGTSDRSLSEIHPSFVAKYIRIYPLGFWNAMCMKVEVYGCNETVDCTHVIKLGQDQRVAITTPSYPLPYRDAAHCNWLVYLPKPKYPISIVAMDFDVGGSALDQESCANEVVKVYRNFHSFSKYLTGRYCNNSKMVMPREVKLSTGSLRVSFTGGDNHIARHRGFSLLLWSSDEEYKTVKACWNTTITLDCTDAEQDIEVISAYYGRRPNSPVCSAENGTAVNTSLYTDSCKAPDVLPKLQTTCDYRNVCKIEVNDENFPHGCTSGDPLEMFVVYQCNITKHISTTSLHASASTTIMSTLKTHSTLSGTSMSTVKTHVSTLSSTSASSTIIHAVTTTTPPPTTTTAPPTTLATTTKPVITESEDTTTNKPHGAATKILAQPAKYDGQSIVLIVAIAGGVFILIMVVIAIITCICCRRNRNNEKAELAKKGVVPSESTQSKVMVESESLYEKIDELEMDPVRYSEAEPNKYSPLRDARRGMSDNPLYQSGGPPKANSSYDVPSIARYENHNHLHRPQSVGNPLHGPSAASPPRAPEPNYIDVLKSPEELPSNSPPMVKYLEPSRSSPPEFRVTIPLERYSDSVDTPTGSSAGGDDVYEAMDGSNA